ncbi:hypothetical protein AMTR_s00013p00260750 [Amborella trichopoda]|uniref:Uncharacterized protein n=1 Tax=Amborella trichopoda TaxID=13333 RepID=W1PQL6_AMBTC|nr:hypothetical protein AMTR_s00013p00260750 [Amborella trichopoda]
MMKDSPKVNGFQRQRGMNTVKEVLHLLDNSSIAGLHDIKVKILHLLEFIGTMAVDIEKLRRLDEGIIQGTKRVASAQDVVTLTFPGIIAEKE